MKNDKNEVMQGTIVAAFIFVVLAIMLLGLMATGLYGVGQLVENKTGSLSLEDRCEFVIKTSGEAFNISEPNAGTFKYELYATPDGYVEVWKCNNF